MGDTKKPLQFQSARKIHVTILEKFFSLIPLFTPTIHLKKRHYIIVNQNYRQSAKNNVEKDFFSF